MLFRLSVAQSLGISDVDLHRGMIDVPSGTLTS